MSAGAQPLDIATSASSGAESRLFVSIVMPALNEERYLAAAVDSARPLDGSIDYEILILDGGSTDRTREIASSLAARDARVRLVPNPRRVQSAAMNIAADVADPRARYLVRADCHAVYPPGFVERCVARLRETGAASVVVAMRTRGAACTQRAIAAAQNSRLGNGGAAHRIESASGFVDHGHHAAFDRKVFQALGGYDESFAYNEDAELDVRLVRSGRRIYLAADAAIDYFPRASLTALARQYFRFGLGRANTLCKHAMWPRLRQVLPVLALVACVVSIAAAPLVPLALLIPLLYAGICLGWGAIMAVRERSVCLLLVGVAAMVMHMSWGAGFLKRLIWGR